MGGYQRKPLKKEEKGVRRKEWKVNQEKVRKLLQKKSRGRVWVVAKTGKDEVAA